jgi:hypothetical protein
MNSEYGNTGWQIFVYSTYIFVAISLFLYIFMSIYSRKKSLKAMQEEGFFNDKKSDLNPKEDIKE